VEEYLSFSELQFTLQEEFQTIKKARKFSRSQFNLSLDCRYRPIISFPVLKLSAVLS